MDIKEFKASKKAMENDLRRSIAKVLRSFENDTGYFPSSIAVEILEFEPERAEPYALISVLTDIEL